MKSLVPADSFIVIPYTYLIGWRSLDIWYYGVRYAKDSHPSDLWTKYWTSSKYVKAFVKQHGEPDVIEIRRTFNDANKAREWEKCVLVRMRVVRSSRWLNKSDAISISADVWKGRKQTQDHKDRRASATRRPLIVNGVLFNSRAAVAEFYKCSRSLISSLWHKQGNAIVYDFNAMPTGHFPKGFTPANKGKKCKAISDARKLYWVEWHKTHTKVKHVCKGISPEIRLQRSIDVTVRNKIRVKCPHCGKVGQKTNMTRWHFDKCKQHTTSDEHHTINQTERGSSPDNIGR